VKWLSEEPNLCDIHVEMPNNPEHSAQSSRRMGNTMDGNTARTGVLLAAKILRRARAADQQKLVEQGRRLVGAISAVHDSVRQGDSAQTRQNAKAVITELASAVTSIQTMRHTTTERQGQ
jgi:hypothetical protein